jgi:hypothetical protein
MPNPSITPLSLSQIVQQADRLSAMPPLATFSQRIAAGRHRLRRLR